MSLNSLPSEAMESRKDCVNRGKYSVFTVHSSTGGGSFEYLKRDCGDYVEVEPKGVYINHGGIVAARGRIPDELKFKDEDTLSFSIPGFVLKLPKELPKDITERVKLMKRISDETKHTLIRSVTEAYNKAMAGTGAELVTVEKVEESFKSYDEVEKLCDELNKV